MYTTPRPCCCPLLTPTQLPLPPGALPTLYNNDARYIDEYLTENPGYYTSGDAGMIDEDG